MHFANKLTLKGVFTHETLYHLHELWKTEEGKPEGPNVMRKFYDSKMGKNHSSGSQHNINETEKLKSTKKK